jgi:hypothetical protein
MGASDLLYDDVADRVLIADPSADLLLAMDPDTGQRNTVSDTGDGAALLSGSRLAHDPGRGVVYVAGGGTIVVGRIDLGTGLRERIASQDDDRGRRTTAYYDIAYDAANDRALLRENDRLTQLELATLQRRQVAELPTADEYTSPTWGDMHFDPQTGELLVAGTDQLVRMPLTLADEVGYFSGPLSGSGPNFTSYGLAAYGGDIFAAAYWDDAIMRINPETGDREVFADSASSGVAFGDPVSLALDSSGSRLLAIADTSGGVPSLVAFNLETGSGTLLSGPETGDTDPAIVSGADLCIRVDGANDRALLANGDHVLAVDLSTAARAEFSGPSVGNGPLPTEFRDLAYDSWHDQYVAIGDGDQILAIDPTTGDRDVISSTADGSPGPALTDPESIAFLYGDQAVLVRDGSGELVHVALANGGRRESLRGGLYARDMAVFDGALLASMPSNDEIGRIELLSTESTQIGRWGMRALHLPPVMQDLASGAGYVVDPGNALTVLDLVAGRLSTVEGSGAAGDYRTDSFLNVSGGLAYVTTTPFFTSGSAALYQVDLATAESVVIASASVGSGTEPTSYNSGAFDGARGRALVFDANLGALISVNPDDGVRENVSGGPVGEGEPWDQPLQVLYDANGDRALVLDGAVVVSVDLQTGDRTALTGGGAGSGDPLMQPRAMALDLGGNRLIVRDTDTRSFVAVSLSDGARSPLVSDVEGIPAGAQGSLGPEPTRFDYDGARRVIFVAALTDRGPRGLLEVDELSGDWVLLDLQ